MLAPWGAHLSAQGGKICHSTATGKEENHESLSKKLRNLTQTNFQRQIRAVIASSSFFTEALGILPFKKSHVKANTHELPFPNSLTFIYLKDCSHRAISSCSTQSPKGLGTECFYILPETYKFLCFVPQNFRTLILKYFTEKSDLKLAWKGHIWSSPTFFWPAFVILGMSNNCPV